MIDYSKALYHLENLDIDVLRAETGINSKDISIKFLYDCIKEKIKTMKDMKERYESFISSFFTNTDRVYKVKTENRTFYIFKDKSDMIKFINKNKEGIFREIRNMAVFYTDKGKVFIPEREENVLHKPYIFMGRFPVLIGT
jgi:hypothetical protein